MGMFGGLIGQSGRPAGRHAQDTMRVKCHRNMARQQV
jgi:hypothetical protein